MNVSKYIILLCIFLFCTDIYADERLISEAKESLKSQLKDPYSVVFEKIFMSNGANGAPIVCGEFNAKNSYGGYVGNKRFNYIKTDGKPIINIEGSSMISIEIYDALCNTNK